MKRALLIVAAMVITLVFTAGAWAEEPLANRLDRLEAKVARYEAILRYLVVDTNTINGLRGPHVIFRGANVHIQSGSNATNGLGNLIIGNNEMPGGGPSPTGTNRTGSHNLVIGFGHSYSASGGFVAGTMNSISGQASSVSGGTGNTASGKGSSILGGSGKVAATLFQTVP